MRDEFTDDGGGRRGPTEGRLQTCLMPDVSRAKYRAFAELLVSASDVARPFRDEEGRPLGERYLPTELRDDVTFEMRRCPYSGSRLGREMNVSALRGVINNWRAVISELALLRDAFCRRHGLQRLNWLDIWILARTATAAAAFLVRRPDSSIDVVPTRIAALFKPAVGLYMTAERIFFTGANYGATPNVRQFITAIEETGAFLSSHGACSGPPRRVEEIVSTIIDGGRTSDVTASWAADGAGFNRLLEYGRAVSVLEVAKGIHFLELHERLQSAAAQGLLDAACNPRQPRSLRGVSVDPVALGLTLERLRDVAKQLDLDLPAAWKPFNDVHGSGIRTREAATPSAALVAAHEHELHHDRLWIRVFEKMQVLVNELLDLQLPRDAIRLETTDLARIAAYTASSWHVRSQDIPSLNISTRLLRAMQ